MTFSSKAGVLLAILMLSAGCGASTKYVTFNILESGNQVPVTKFFNDGFGSDASAKNAFKAAQSGDLLEATKIMQGRVATNPNNAWDHYNLAILYEAASQWDKAEAELKESIRIEPKQKSFRDELAFIERHKASLAKG